MLSPLTSGAWTTASTPVPPTAPPASATATATLGILAAHVSQQMSYCRWTYTLVYLVSDDATAKAKFSKVLNKSYNKVQSLKTKQSLKSTSVLSIYLIFVQEISNMYFLGFMVNDDKHDQLCLALAEYALFGCLGVDSVVCDDTLMACMVSFLSDDCHDLACGVLDDANSFLSCP